MRSCICWWCAVPHQRAPDPEKWRTTVLDWEKWDNSMWRKNPNLLQLVCVCLVDDTASFSKEFFRVNAMLLPHNLPNPQDNVRRAIFSFFVAIMNEADCQDFYLVVKRNRRWGTDAIGKNQKLWMLQTFISLVSNAWDKTSLSCSFSFSPMFSLMPDGIDNEFLFCCPSAEVFVVSSVPELFERRFSCTERTLLRTAACIGSICLE